MVSDRWHALELRHVAALKAVSEEGTFAAAAAKLGYTQSAVSQQIAALERLVGVRLLDRRPGQRPAGLTRAGTVVLRHGIALLERTKAVEADLAAVADGTVPEVRVGTYQSVGIHVLPPLLRGFRAQWPHVDVRLRESASDVDLLADIERGQLDLTFCMLPIAEGPFASAQLLADPYVLVVPRDSPLVRRSRVRIRDIAEQPLIGFRSCRNEQRIEAQLRTLGFDPLVVFRSDDNGTVQALVADGVGIALMPRLTVNFDDPRTRFIDVAERFPARLLGLVWHRDRELSAPVQALMVAARAICDRLSLEPPALIASDPLRQSRRRRHPQEGTPRPRDRRAT